MIAPVWTPEHDELLRSCLKTGMSCTTAAGRINETFRTSYSRCAVLGRAHRLGIVFHGQPAIKVDLAKAAKETVTVSRRKRMPRSDFNGGTDDMAASETDSAPIVVPIAEPVPLLKLKQCHCRAVVEGRGEDGLSLFCGVQKRKGSSWCHSHYRLYVTSRAYEGQSS